MQIKWLHLLKGRKIAASKQIILLTALLGIGKTALSWKVSNNLEDLVFCMRHKLIAGTKIRQNIKSICNKKILCYYC